MNNCSHFEHALTALAHGEDAPLVEEHLAECEACRLRLGELRRMVHALAVPTSDAPVLLIEAAKALMPHRQRTIARLVRSTLGMAGARAEDADTFQMVYESEPMRARLLYERLATGWSVTGKIEGGVVAIEAQGSAVNLEADGRFAFVARSLADTECLVWCVHAEIVIPAAALIKPDGNEPSA